MIIELANERGERLSSIDLWDLVAMYYVRGVSGLDFEKLRLYADGQEIPKPPEREEEG